MFFRVQPSDQYTYETSITLGNEQISSSLHHNLSFQDSPYIERSLSKSTTSIDQEGGISFTAPVEASQLLTEEVVTEKPLKGSRSEGGMSANSVQTR